MQTKLKHVVVDWWDAYSEHGEYRPFRGDKGLPSISSGFLLEDNKNGVRVGQIAHLHSDGDVSYKNTMFIPRGMVRKVTVTATSYHKQEKKKP